MPLAAGWKKSTSAGKIDYIFDLSGNVVTEWYVNYSNYTGWGVSHIYFNGNLLAQYRYGTTQFMHKDHLGSTRLVTGVNQAISDNLDYLPFGEQYSGSSVTSHKFTGKERDAETGLDNFGARYDSSALGRFMSPDWSSDPEPVPYAKLGNPQTLNLYAYVNNNPINAVDLDGHNYAGMDGLNRDTSGTGLPMSDSFFSTGDDNTHDTEAERAQNQPQPQQQAQQQQQDPQLSASAKYILGTAGRQADVGVKAAMIATSPQYAVMGAAAIVEAAPAVTPVAQAGWTAANNASLSLYVRATTALTSASTAISNAYAAGTQFARQTVVTIDTLKSGGGAIRAAGDLVQGATSPSRVPNNPFGWAGWALRQIFAPN